MWMYSQTPDPNELYHYGVLGMKWGVRKNRSEAYRKATAKRERLKTKLDKAKSKSQNAEMKLAKRRSKKAKTEIGYGLQERAFRSANSKKYKAMKAEKRLNKWEKAMAKEFGSHGLTTIKEVPMSKKEAQSADAYFKKLERAEAKLNSQLQKQASAGNRNAHDYLYGTGSFVIEYDKNGNPTVKKKR